MKPSALFLGIIYWLGTSSATYPAPVDTFAPVATAPLQVTFDPVLGGALQTNDVFTEGSAYLVIPMWSNLAREGKGGGSLLFVQPQYSAIEGDGFAASLGFGFRQYLAPTEGGNGFMSEGIYFGASLFADLRRTPAENSLWQMGAGLEAGSRYVSVRANYYQPLTDRKRSGELKYGAAYHSLVVEGTPYYDFVAAQIGSAIETWGVYEEPMRGWDAEVALLIPGLDQITDLQVLLGYQDLDADSGALGSEIRGWKAGVEWRPVPAIALSAVWLDDERYRGTDWIAGVRVEIPLGDRKALKDAFSFRRRPVVERLTQPVVRQSPAIQVARTAMLERTDVQLHSFVTFDSPLIGAHISESYSYSKHLRHGESPGIALDLMPTPGIVFYTDASSAFAGGLGRSLPSGEELFGGGNGGKGGGIAEAATAGATTSGSSYYYSAGAAITRTGSYSGSGTTTNSYYGGSLNFSGGFYNYFDWNYGW
jgi:hypothetical protein